MIKNSFFAFFLTSSLVNAGLPQGTGYHVVAIRSEGNSNWMTADGGGGGKLTAHSHTIGPWETFRLYCYDETCKKISLLSLDNHWVSTENNGGGNVNANRTFAFSWERFRLIRVADDVVAFETGNKHYLSIDNADGDLINSKSSKVTKAETFSILEF